MSVTFFGWDVVYDDNSLVLELGAEQEPQKGDAYTMYHGTNVQTARLIITNGFRQSPDGMLGPGVYVSRNQQKAARYPLKSPPSDRVVLQLRVNTGRVKRIDKDNHPMQKSWNAAGYDTAWVPPNCGMQSVPSGMEEDCVFDPQRVVVTSIAKAPNPTIMAELMQLVSQKRPGTGRGGDMQVAVAGGVCTLCRRKTTPDHTHTLHPCWGCGQNICTLMTKHTCSASA
ncbi:GCRV-induced gene 2p isoform 1-T2 [Salvelinus alpinus]